MNKAVVYFTIGIFLLLKSGVSYGQIRWIYIDPYKWRFVDISLNASMASYEGELYYYTKRNNAADLEHLVYGEVKCLYNYGISTYAGINIAKFSDKDALGISLGMVATVSKFTLDNSGFDVKNGLPFSEEYNSFRMYVPISLDYKSGAEAADDRSYRTMYTLGAGICPKITEGTAFSPFIKAEFGYFMGIAFKLRAQYLFGHQVWASDAITSGVSTDERPDHISYYKIKSNGELQLSLAIMMFSYKWD